MNNSNSEVTMNTLKSLWTRIVRFFEILEGADDPIGDYILAVGKRVEKLERDLDHLKRHADISKR